jgi:hypothetical protein
MTVISRAGDPEAISAFISALIVSGKTIKIVQKANVGFIIAYEG